MGRTDAAIAANKRKRLDRLAVELLSAGFTVFPPGSKISAVKEGVNVSRYTVSVPR